jgi:hypothetical protein
MVNIELTDASGSYTKRQIDDIALVRRAQRGQSKACGFPRMFALEQIEDHLAVHEQLTAEMRAWLGEATP